MCCVSVRHKFDTEIRIYIFSIKICFRFIDGKDDILLTTGAQFNVFSDSTQNPLKTIILSQFYQKTLKPVERHAKGITRLRVYNIL